MKYFSFSRFFGSMWNNGKRNKRKSKAPLSYRRTLLLESLEDRLSPSVSTVLPAPLVANTASIGGGFDPQIAIDPINSQVIAAVWTTGTALAGKYSNDGGQSWNAFALPVNVIDPSIPGPGNSASVTKFSTTVDPSIAFDRSEQLYVVSAQENATNSSGAIVIDKFDFSNATNFTVKTVALTPPPPPTGIVGGQLQADLGQGILYRWDGNDQGYHPIVATDINLASYTDPVNSTTQTDTMANVGIKLLTTIKQVGGIGPTDTTVNVASSAGVPATPFIAQIDSEQMLVTNVNAGTNTWTITRGVNGTTATAHANGAQVGSEITDQTNGVPVPKAVYVAWNVDFTQPAGQNGPTTVSRVVVDASADGGHSFTNFSRMPQQNVSNALPAGMDESSPQAIFNQGTSAPSPTATDVVGGQLTFFYTTPGNIYQNTSQPDGGVAIAPVAATQDFTFAGGSYFTSPTYTGTVNINAANLTTINDLTVTINFTAVDLTHIGMTLTPPTGSGLAPITLFNYHTDSKGNSFTNVGLTNGGVLLGNEIAPVVGSGQGGGPGGTVFDEFAPRAINDLSAVTPYVGNFRPEAGTLAEVNGVALSKLDGTWTLTITDTNTYMPPPAPPPEFLSNWSLHFSGIISTKGFGADPAAVSGVNARVPTAPTTGGGLPAETTLAGPITAAQTTIKVASLAGFPSTTATGPFTIVVGTEVMQVTKDTSTTWTVVRGFHGTTAVASAGGTTVIYGGTSPAVGSPGNTSPFVTAASGSAGIQPGLVAAVDNTLGGSSPYQDRIYLAYTTNGGGIDPLGDNTGVELVSADYSFGGWTWNQPVQVNNDTPTDNFSEGNRPQFMPTLTVDQTNGNVVVGYYDGRNDPAHARMANSIVVSNDGGQTFSENSYLNQLTTATNFLNNANITVGPIPGNQALAGTFGFGDRQGLVSFGGKVYPLFATNLNAGGSTIDTATVTTAAGPRVVYGDQGPITQDFNDPLGFISYNNTFASDGTRRFDGFVVQFDRPVSIASFTAADVQVQYQNPKTGATSMVPLDPTTPIMALDSGYYGSRSVGFDAVGTATMATEFFVKLATPQTSVGTYSYAIGPTVTDLFQIATALVNALLSTDTTMTVASDIGVGIAAPFVVEIDNEQILVTGGTNTNTWTITRGYNGTTPAAHSSGATVNTLGNMMDQNTNAVTGESVVFPTQATTSLFGFMATTDQSLFVLDPSSFPTTAPFVIQIDSEQMQVTSVSGSFWTVLRGFNGTTIAAHQDGTTINSVNAPDLYSVPLPLPVDSVAAVAGAPFRAPYDTNTLPLSIPGPHVVLTSVPNTTSGAYTQPVTTTDVGGIFSTDTSMTVASSTGFPATTPFVVQIGFEQIQVTAVAGTTWTINRGFNNTPISAHQDGALITYTPPNTVVNATNSSFDVTFDRDIMAGTFTAADILSITGPSGPVNGPYTVTADPTGTPAALAKRVFRIGFPAQALSGAYNIVISPGVITDTAGNGVDTNLNAGLDVLRGAVSNPATAVITQQVFTGPGVTIPANGSVSSKISVAQAFQILQSTSQYDFAGQTTNINQSGGIGVADQTMTVTSSFGFPTSATVNTPFIVQIDTEEIAVTNVTGTTWTIVRGYNGTTPAPHLNNALITLGLHETVQVKLNISFPNLPNLTATLTSPNSTTVLLFSNVGSLGTAHNDMNNVVFDDTATAPIQTAQAPIGPGTFNPQTPLSAFSGLGSQGNWTLTITNNGNKSGTLTGWQLTLPKSTTNSGLGEPIADEITGSFSIFTQSPGNPQSSTQWTAVGPLANPTGVIPGTSTTDTEANAGPVTALAVDKSDPSGNTVYAGGASGGIWKSTNFLTTDPRGPSWTPLTDFGPTNSVRISGITLVDRNNDPSQTIVLAVTGTGPKTVTQLGAPAANDTTTVGGPGVGFLRSTDAGKTWVVLDSTNNVDANGNILPMQSTSRDHLFVGTIGFQIVADPTPLPGGTLNGGNIAVYAALSGTNGGLYRSLDDGNTWTLVRAGNATSVVLAAAGRNINGNLNVLYAGFAGDGVYSAVGDATTATNMVQLTGGNISTPRVDADAPSLGAYEIGTGAPANTPNNTAAHPIGNIVLAVPSATNSPLADTFYQGWVYAAVANANGSFDALFVTKDGGDNWTQVNLPLYTPRPGVLIAYPTNNELDPSYGPSAGDTTVNGQNIQNAANYTLTLAVDPTNPNIAYLGGSANGTATPPLGMLRVDITQLSDPYAFIAHSNNENDGGLSMGASVGPTNTKGGAYGIIDPYSPIGATYNSYYNLYRVPLEPFVSPSSLQFTGVPSNLAGTAIGFNNDGTDAKWMPFNDGLMGSTNQLSIVAVPDPLTGGTRVIFGDDQGVYTQVAGSDGSTLLNEGTTTIPTGSRNGDLQIAQLYSGSVQPSTTSAALASALFYAQSFDGNTSNSSSTILTDGNLAWGGNPGPGAVNSNVLSTGQVVGFGGIATDQTGSGQSYQFVYPSTTVFPLVPTDFFQVTPPNQLPATRVSGLVQSAASSPSGLQDIPGLNQGQWPEFLGSNFTVNQFDPTAIVVGSQEGQVFLTNGPSTGTGVKWNPIATPAQLDGTYPQALAFGSPTTSGSGTPDNLIYAGTQGGNIYVTFTGGGTWNNISAGLDGSPIQQIVTDPTFGSHQAYAVTAQGVYWMPNSGSTSATTLNGAIDAVTTTITVNSITGFPAAPFVIKVGTEQMQVTAVAGTTWTVTRGFNGTTAGAHANGAQVTYQTQPQWVPIDLIASTTLAAPATNVATAITVNSAAGFSAAVPFVINVGSEQMLVTNVNGTTWTVVRGYNDTTAIAQAMGAAVDERAMFNITRPSFNNATQINQVNGISAAANTMTVSSSAGFPAAPFVVMVGAEKMQVTAVNGNVWSITRGYGGTAITAHANGTTVTNQDPYFAVHYLTSLQADWRFAITSGSSGSISTTLNGAVDAVTTTLNVASTSAFPTTPFVIRMGTELMQVTNTSGTTWTVIRGFDNTTPVAQANGATVTLLPVPVLYVAGSGGVFRSINQGLTWNYYPNVAGDPTGDGYLPNTDVTSLSLALGNFNPTTGFYDNSAGLNMLVASTFGRGEYAIRLDNSAVSKFLVAPNSGPMISSSSPTVTPTGQSLTGFTVTFVGAVDPSTFSPADVTVTGPGGVPVQVATVTDISGTVNHNVYQIVFTTPQSTAGNYTWKVGPFIDDFSGNPMDQNHNGINGEVPGDIYTRTFNFVANTPPTITGIGNQIIAPGTSTSALAFTVGSQLTPAASLVVTASSNNPSVIPNTTSNLVLGGSGANRTVTVVAPGGSTYGSSLITLTVTDNFGLQTSTSFTVYVDSAPTIPAVTYPSGGLPNNFVVTHGATIPPYLLNAVDNNPSGSLTYTTSILDPLYTLQQKYGLTTSLDGLTNQLGYNEKYLVSSNKSNAPSFTYVLMPTGNLYAWKGSITATLASTPIQNVGAEVYYNPSLLTTTTGAPLVTTGANPLYDLKVQYGLTTPVSSSLTNLRKGNEEYLISTNKSNPTYGGTYVLLPNDKLYAYEGVLGSSVSSSAPYGTIADSYLTLIADLTPYGNVYANPSLLTSATLPTAVGVTAVVSTPPSGGSLQMSALPGFDRSVQVTVNASDGVISTPTTFTFTVTNTAPTVAPIGPLTTPHLTPLTPFNLNAMDAQSDPLTYTTPATVVADNPFYDLKTQFAINNYLPNLTNQLKAGDKWFTSSTMNAPSYAYVLMPTEKLYAWQGTLSSTLSSTPIADFSQSQYTTYGNAYNTPTLLSAALQPGVPTVPVNSGLVYNVKEQLGLDTPDETKVFNQFGAGEKWFVSSNGSNPTGGYTYVLLPSGLLYAWDGNSLATTMKNAPVADLSSAGVYANTSLLYSAQPTTINDQIYAVREQYGLDTADLASQQNQFKMGEKYLLSSNNSNPLGGNVYVLMPSDKLYAWDGHSLATTIAQPAVFDFTPYGNVYATPSLLYSDLGQAPAVSATVSNAGLVTLTQDPRFVGTTQVSTRVSDGAQFAQPSFMFSSTDTAPVVSAAPGNQMVAHNAAVPGFKLNATDAESDPLTYVPQVSGYSPLFNLKSQLGLTSPTYGYNFGGKQEKYFTSTNGSNSSGNNQYVLYTDNKLYAWDNVSLSTTLAKPAIFDFAPYGNVYANPALLYNAAPPQAIATVASNRGPLYDIREQYGLNSADLTNLANQFGMGEKYFVSTNGSNPSGGNTFVLLPNGKLYAWDGLSLTTTLTTPPVANVSSEGVYSNTALLFKAQPVFINDPVYNVKELYGLNSQDLTPKYNQFGMGEKYFVSSNGSNAPSHVYVLMPTNKLYAWDGISLATTIAKTPIFDFTTVPVDIYDNTALLYNSTGQVPAVSAVVDSSGNVTLTPNVAFAGTVRVGFTISDGAKFTTTSMLLTVADGAPVISPISAVSTPTATNPTSVTISTSDPEGDPLQFAATAFNPFYLIQTQYGLNTQELTAKTNQGGKGEKYFVSSNGSNAPSLTYVLMPNDMLYAWDGVSLATTIAKPAVVDFSQYITPFGNVYNNTSLLYNATPPASPGSISTSFTGTSTNGATLNLGWPNGFTGSFLTTVYVGDGAEETQQTFLVTVH